MKILFLSLILFLITPSITISFAQTKTTKALPKPAQASGVSAAPVAGAPTTAPAAPYLNQVVESAKQRLMELAKEYEAARNPYNPDMILKLDLDRINAEWIVQHEVDLTRLYESFVSAAPQLPDPSIIEKDWLDSQQINLNPADPCKDINQGCTVKISLSKLQLYFKQIAVLYQNESADKKRLEASLASPYATNLMITLPEALAAIEVWNQYVLDTRSKTLPILSVENGKLIKQYPSLKQVQITVAVPKDLLGRITAESEATQNADGTPNDQKLLIDKKINITDYSPKEIDTWVWNQIFELNILIDQIPINQLERLYEFTKHFEPNPYCFNDQTIVQLYIKKLNIALVDKNGNCPEDSNIKKANHPLILEASKYFNINPRKFDWYQGTSNSDIILAISKHSLYTVYLYTHGDSTKYYNTLLTPTQNKNEYIVSDHGKWLYRFDNYTPQKSMRFWIDKYGGYGSQWDPQTMIYISPY